MKRSRISTTGQRRLDAQVIESAAPSDSEQSAQHGGDEIEELLRAAEAAEAEACAMLPTAAEERAIIDAAEELAGGEAGVPAKSRAVVLRLETKWLQFVERHGE